MDILIGAQALIYHKRINRDSFDYDLLSLSNQGLIKENGLTKDYSYVFSTEKRTNKDIYDYCLKNSQHFMFLPDNTKVIVAPLEILKLLYSSSLPLQKNKHLISLEALKDIKLDDFLETILEKRSKETEVSVLRQHQEKDIFFNKYEIQRFIDHDKLHLFLNPEPIYLKFLKKDSYVEIDQKIFESANFEDKQQLIFEETIVLMLERFFIPKVKLMPHFFNDFLYQIFLTDTHSVSLFYLNKLTNKNLLKDHPQFIADFGYNNYPTLEYNFKNYLPKALDDLSEDFWLFLLNN